MDSSALELEIVVMSIDFDARSFVAPWVLLAGVAKASARAMFFRLKYVFEAEGGERLGFEFGKMKVEESERVEVE